MEEHYEMEITPIAYEEIQTKLKNKENPEEYGFVIADKHAIGSGYDFHVYKIAQLDEIGHYGVLFPRNYHNYGFPIYIDRQILMEHMLPHKFIIDLVKKMDGSYRLDIKNPEFEK